MEEEEDRVGAPRSLFVFDNTQKHRSNQEFYNDIKGNYAKNENNLIHLIDGYDHLAENNKNGRPSKKHKHESLSRKVLLKKYKECGFLPNGYDEKKFDLLIMQTENKMKTKKGLSLWLEKGIFEVKEKVGEKYTFGFAALHQDLLKEKSDNKKKIDQITELKQIVGRLEKEREATKQEFMSYKEESESKIKLRDEKITGQEEEIKNLKCELQKKNVS
eukprot:TRINITY_DN34653_c0_g1_i1.p1 TRINITY_DN34653_c0_g1~~TRINITY_DN34653_c0_g1_i1.p1  ORF type:complete len:217 (+),score=45.80 TRINITY_DN34653_c0_g1_i1:48-698(+)